MKRRFVSLVFSFYCASLSVAGVKTDLQKDNLIGSVRTVQIETTHVSKSSGQWAEGPRELSATITYDAKGNKTEVVGTVFSGKTLYTYNAQGDLIEEVSYNSDG